ncbi:MAG TPA: hypothetical protein VGN26_18910 [Armatimonadota bacterium]|jgi:hypothetical protein
MRVSRREALLQMGAASALCASGAGASTPTVLITGVDRYRVLEPVFEGVRVILAKRGESYTPAYLQGLSGAAFRVAGPCGCAPTCAGAMGPEALARLLGYEVTQLSFEGRDVDLEKRLGEVLPQVKEELRQGRPVLVFHAFTTAEFDVVCGFDEDAKRLYGRGSYAGTGKDYAEAPEDRMIRCTEICPPIGAVLIGRKTGKLDARRAEVAALKEAVRFARSSSKTYPYPGLHCYDLWLSIWQASDPAPKPDFARDGYGGGIYASTSHAAAEFLREIAPSYPTAAQSLKDAAFHFDAQSQALGKLTRHLFPKAGTQPRQSGDARARTVELLGTARAAYEAGIQGIELALVAI